MKNVVVMAQHASERGQRMDIMPPGLPTLKSAKLGSSYEKL
jgi:hypothetical protein